MKRYLAAMYRVGFDPAAAVDSPPVGSGVSDGGGGSPAPSNGAGGGSPTPPASPAGAHPGSATPGGQAALRTFSEEQVQGMIRDRVAKMNSELDGWRKLGDPKDIQSRLDRAGKVEAMLRGDGPPQPSPEDLELRQLLEKNGFVRADKVQTIEQKLAAMEQQAFQRVEASARETIGKFANEKFGVTDPKALSIIEGAVAASIGTDEADVKAYLSGDPGVVQKHLDLVYKERFDPLLRAAAAKYSGAKARDVSEVPPSTPRGGVQAPISQEKPLSPEERREAAFKWMKEREGQG